MFGKFSLVRSTFCPGANILPFLPSSVVDQPKNLYPSILLALASGKIVVSLTLRSSGSLGSLISSGNFMLWTLFSIRTSGNFSPWGPVSFKVTLVILYSLNRGLNIILPTTFMISPGW